MKIERRTFVVRNNAKRVGEGANDYFSIVDEKEIPMEKLMYAFEETQKDYSCASFHFEQREVVKDEEGNILSKRIKNKSPNIIFGTRVSEEDIYQFLGQDIGEALILDEKLKGNEEFFMCVNSRLIIGMPEGTFDFFEYRKWEEYNERQYPYSAFDLVFAKSSLLRPRNTYENEELNICRTSEYVNNWGLMYRIRYLSEYGREIAGVKEDSIPDYVPNISEVETELSDGMFTSKINTGYSNSEAEISRYTRNNRRRLRKYKRFWNEIEKRKNR